MSYIKFHSGKFNVRTRDVREGLHGLPGLNVMSVLISSCDIDGLHDLSTNGLDDMYANGMNVISITPPPPCDASGLNELSVHVCPRDVGESRDAT